MLVVWWREERVRDGDDEKKGMEKKANIGIAWAGVFGVRSRRATRGY